MVKCPECGNEVGDNNFCGKCGEKIDKNKICPKCNTEVDEENIFCPECGEKLKDEEKTTTEEKKETKEKISSENKEDSKDENKEEKELNYCPHCNTKIYDKNTDFCPECGKSVKIDIQSFEGIKYTIQTKNVLIFSLISILFTALLSIIFSIILGMISSTVDLYPIGFIVSLIIIIAIFGSFKDLINGGLVGIITGLVLGLLAPTIVELSSSFKFSYVMFSGYAPILFTIIGAIVGVISTKYIRNKIVNKLDVEQLF